MLHRFLYRFIAIAGVIALAAILRLWQIDSIPPGFHLDESYQGLEAWRILTEPDYHPFYLRGNFGPLPGNAYLNVVTFWLVTLVGGEAGPIAMRLTAAFIGTLTVASIFGLAREMRLSWPIDQKPTADIDSTEQNGDFSLAFPIAAAIFLATMRWHIHYSRMGIESIYVPLIWTVGAWLLLNGWRTGRWMSFAASGVMLGLGMYTYRGAWSVPFILALLLLHLSVRKYFFSQSPMNELHQRLQQAVLWGTVALIVVAPLILFYINNPSLFFVRLEQVNIVGETGSPADATVWINAQKMTQMFGPFGAVGDPDPRRNLPDAAALSWPFALFFYIGVGVSLWRIRHPIFALPLYGLVGILLLGVFSEFAPHFHRVFGAAAPTALLCAIGFDWLWQRSVARIGRLNLHSLQENALRIAIAILLLLGITLEFNNYFLRWANMSSLYHAFDEGFWEIGQAIADLPTESPVYITPRDLEHHTLAFAWEKEHPRTSSRACSPLPFDGRYAFPLTDGTNEQPEYYALIEHEDFRTPLLLPGVLPTSIIYREFLDYKGQVYARIYERPAMSESARPPHHSLDVTLGDGIRLIGYDVQPAEIRRGEILYLQLHWVVEETPNADWTVFTHVRTQVSDEPRRMAGHDSKPGNGSLSTNCWKAGQRILDEYQIQLPDDLPVEAYDLFVGLYQPDGEQLPADRNGVRLGAVQILDRPD